MITGPIEPARVEFRDGRTPVSLTYGDVYYSHETGGLEESRHVFLEHNRIAARFAARQHGLFTIGETGFGTGLNFCESLRLFRERAPANLRLLYISCEKHPLRADDLRAALGVYPELQREAGELLERYPPAHPGLHVLHFGPRATLYLMYGEALECYAALEAGHTWNVDAWFLDGFAPAKNPDMWMIDLFQELARLSADDASFATYTSAGMARRALADAGFTVEKIPGFARKRDMLRGRFIGRRAQVRVGAVGDVRSAVVIGAGLAGTAAAAALNRRGIKVTLLDGEDGAGRRASGNTIGVAVPALSASPTAAARYAVAACGYLHRLLREIDTSEPPIFLTCGALLLAHAPALTERYRRSVAALALPEDFARYVEVAEASQLAGITLAHGGIYFPHAPYISPPQLCSAHLADTPIETRWRSAATALRRDGDAWEVFGDDGALLARGDAVIIADGAERLALLRDVGGVPEYPLKTVRGQTCAVAGTAASTALRLNLCYDGYVSPAVRMPGGTAFHHVGATFEEWNEDPNIIPEQNRRMLDTLADRAPAFAGITDTPEALHARAAFRTASRDRLPLVGPVHFREHLRNFYLEQLKSGRAPTAVSLPCESQRPEIYVPGLHVLTALGSRGLLYAHIGAEYLAGRIAGEIPGLERDLMQALAPARFDLRELRRTNRRELDDFSA